MSSEELNLPQLLTQSMNTLQPFMSGQHSDQTSGFPSLSSAMYIFGGDSFESGVAIPSLEGTLKPYHLRVKPAVIAFDTQWATDANVMGSAHSARPAKCETREEREQVETEVKSWPLAEVLLWLKKNKFLLE